MMLLKIHVTVCVSALDGFIFLPENHLMCDAFKRIGEKT